MVPVGLAVITKGVKTVKPAGYVIPVFVPPHKGASAAEKPVAIVESTTKVTAQYSPAGGDCVVPEMIWHPASPKDCLSVLFVIKQFKVLGFVGASNVDVTPDVASKTILCYKLNVN
jgi:hypothetical protein